MDIKTFLNGQRCVCLDIETTGLDMDFDSIIELGSVELFNGVETERQWQFRDGRSPVYLVRKVHKVKDSDRKNSPSFKESASELKEYLDNAILVGHNLKSFDLPFIQRKLYENGITLKGNKIFDTLSEARKRELPKTRLEDLCARFNIPYGHHRGLGDSISTLALFKKMVETM